MEEKEDEEEDDDGEEKKEMKEKKEERGRNARQSLPRFFREITVGRPTKGISILNPIGGYARPFHLFATGPKLVPSSPLESSSSLSLFSTIPRGGHRRTIRYDRHYLDASEEKERSRRRNRR